MYKFVIRNNKAGHYVVRLMKFNTVKFTSPPLATEAEARALIEDFRVHVQGASVEDKT